MLRLKLYDQQRSQAATYTAAEDTKAGSAALFDLAAGTFAAPAAEAVDNLFFVHKDTVFTGANVARTVFSDWEKEFQDVKEGDAAVLYKFLPGEVFATDQASEALISAPPAIGTALSAGTDGKLQQATIASRYVFAGTETELGNTLVLVRVLDAPVDAT
jgi:hypothetical protein